MPDRSFFHCERCGATTFLDVATPPAHYCPSCGLYTCDTCWNAATLRCDGCSLTRPRSAGMKVARGTLVKLTQVADELALISGREADRGRPRKDLEIARRLLGVKAASLTGIVAQALRGVGPRHAAEADSLTRAASDQLDGIVRALGPLPMVPSSANPGVARMAQVASRLGQARWLRMAALGVLVLAVAATIGIAFITRSAGQDQRAAAGPRTSPEGQVAGSSQSRTPEATPLQTPDAPRVEPVDLTFDSLVTDAAPDGWEVVGGSAAGVAYPNSVDRSVQLVAATQGERASLCTALPDGDVRFVSLELFAREWTGAAVSLERGDGSFGLEVGADGIAAVQPDSTPLLLEPLEPGWYRIGFSLDPDAGRVRITFWPREGEGSSQWEPLPVGWNEAAAADARLCTYAPAPPAEGLFVDNVTIR